MSGPQIQPGWYRAQGDPEGTHRYWDGTSWIGGPQPIEAPPSPSPDQQSIGQTTSIPGPAPSLPGQAFTIPPVTSSFPLADPQKRLMARGIDVIAWGLVAGAAFWGSAAAFLIVSVGALAYEVYLIGTQGATLGKRLNGMKVVREDGGPVDFVTGLTRMGVFIGVALLGFAFLLADLRIILIVLLLAGIGAGAYFIFNDPNRRTPWDQLAKTLVVDA